MLIVDLSRSNGKKLGHLHTGHEYEREHLIFIVGGGKQIIVLLTFELEPCRQGTNHQEESRRVFVSISARVERAFFSAVADCEALKGCRCARGVLLGAVKCSWVRTQIHGAVCGSLSIFVFWLGNLAL